MEFIFVTQKDISDRLALIPGDDGIMYIALLKENTEPNSIAHVIELTPGCETKLKITLPKEHLNNE